MIGAKFDAQRDGGASITIHFSAEDMAEYKLLLQWLMEHGAEVKEHTDETRRYERARLFIDSLPDVDEKLSKLATARGGHKIELMGYAVNLYVEAMAAIERGEQLMSVKPNRELIPMKVDIPWIEPQPPPTSSLSGPAGA